MTDLQFRLTRFLSFPLAAALVLNWFSLPSQLQMEGAVATTAAVSFGTFKQHEVTYLLTKEFGELRVPCTNAPGLCRTPRVPNEAEVQVWIQTPGVLLDRWVAAAKYQGQFLATPEAQTTAYRESKFMWGLGTLFVVALALVFWYFAPFKPASRE